MGGAVAGAVDVGLSAGARCLASAASLPLDARERATDGGGGGEAGSRGESRLRRRATGRCSHYPGGRRFQRVTWAGGGTALAASQPGLACLVRVVVTALGGVRRSVIPGGLDLPATGPPVQL